MIRSRIFTWFEQIFVYIPNWKSFEIACLWTQKSSFFQVRHMRASLMMKEWWMCWFPQRMIDYPGNVHKSDEHWFHSFDICSILPTRLRKIRILSLRLTRQLPGIRWFDTESQEYSDVCGGSTEPGKLRWSRKMRSLQMMNLPYNITVNPTFRR